MTAVLRLKFRNKYPTMIGDLLLSAPLVSQNFYIPTRDGQLIFSPAAEKVPFSLRQKVVVIDDNLVIGWAGDAYPAKDVITGLREKNESTRLTRESFAEYFNSLDDSIKNVTPIYKYVDPNDFVGLVPSSLNSKFICNYFSFRDVHGKNVILVRAEYVGETGATFVRFREEGWKPRYFEVNKDELKQVSEHILHQFNPSDETASP